MTDNNSIYTSNELDVLEKVKGIRLATIDKMVEGGVPEKVGEVRVLNELLSAAEKNVQDSAANRLKHQDNTNKEAILETVSEVLKSVTNAKSSNIRPDDGLDVKTEITTVEVVPGEIEINPSKLLIDDFTHKDS